MNESLLNVAFPSLDDMSVSPGKIKTKVTLHWEFSNNDLSPEQMQARSYFLEFIDHGIKSSVEEGEDKHRVLPSFQRNRYGTFSNQQSNWLMLDVLQRISDF